MKVAAFVFASLASTLLAAPAQADTYPISGRWGVGTPSADGKIDCNGKRVITFSGNQRQDSKGGVPAYRNRTVTPQGPMRFRVVDEFTTGQISNAHAIYTLHLLDDDNIDMQMQPGGSLKLQRCK
jgi:hypothetical protein